MITETTRAGFQTTRWTLVDALRGETRDDALASLVQVYWPPVYARLRRRGDSPDAAAETTQAFFTDVVLGRGLFDRASADAGRLRTLVLTALDRYVIDRHRHRRSRADGFAISVAELVREEEALAGEETVEPDLAFDRRWAGAVLAEALTRAEAHCRASGKAAHWEAFDRHILAPACTPNGSEVYATLAPALGFRTPADAAAAVQVVKRRVLAAMREVVAETTATEAQAEDELRLIRTLLG